MIEDNHGPAVHIHDYITSFSQYHAYEHGELVVSELFAAFAFTYFVYLVGWI